MPTHRRYRPRPLPFLLLAAIAARFVVQRPDVWRPLARYWKPKTRFGATWQGRDNGNGGQEERPNTPDLPLRLPAPPREGDAMSPILRGLMARAEGSNRATDWRDAAETAVRERAFDAASAAYSREAAVYMRLDRNAARAEQAKAARYRLTLQIFQRRLATDADAARNSTGARGEPPLGCYLGAFPDNDPNFQYAYLDEDDHPHHDTGDFEAATGRRHATYFTYLTYGRPFPWRWVNTLKRDGQIPHIAWQPRSLADVRDDDFLERFAEDCRRYDAPIFLRFAAEMNGSWTAWHGNPAAYRAAWRTVAAVIHRAAPKAIMLWCPGAQPVDDIPRYYPGDDAVDWVGVNFYSVIYLDNDTRRPDRNDAADLLRPIYDRYAARKPIAVGEWAASHMAAADRVARPEVAAARIARFYAALPRLFPRVKMVNWYDANNLRTATPDRQLNDYQLTDDPTVLNAYHDATADPWFLGRAGETSGITYAPLRDGATVSGVVALSATTKSPFGRTQVYWSVDHAVRFATARPGPAGWNWDTRRERPGPHRLSLLLYDAQGRFLSSKAVTVTVRR